MGIQLASFPRSKKLPELACGRALGPSQVGVHTPLTLLASFAFLDHTSCQRLLITGGGLVQLGENGPRPRPGSCETATTALHAEQWRTTPMLAAVTLGSWTAKEGALDSSVNWRGGVSKA